MRLLAAALFALGLWIVAVPGAGFARADVPPYIGDMGFPPIQDASGPEEYSWEVQLEDAQELQQLDSQRVQVYYEGHPAMTISAEAAHDATGENVPTTLEATGGDIITLIVHHRAGNPIAGGAPFDYPVLAGPGFESRYQPAIVQMPPVEVLGVASSNDDHCVVPVLKGKSLRASRKQLARRDCSLGRVFRKRNSGKSAKVFEQNPRAGATLSPGGSVSVKLD
jgi:hypothetical protein